MNNLHDWFIRVLQRKLDQQKQSVEKQSSARSHIYKLKRRQVIVEIDSDGITRRCQELFAPHMPVSVYLTADFLKSSTMHPETFTVLVNLPVTVTELWMDIGGIPKLRKEISRTIAHELRHVQQHVRGPEFLDNLSRMARAHLLAGQVLHAFLLPISLIWATFGAVFFWHLMTDLRFATFWLTLPFIVETVSYPLMPQERDAISYAKKHYQDWIEFVSVSVNDRP